MESKKDIRKKVLKARNGISEKEWEEKSRIICEKVIGHPFFVSADAVYCYVDYNQEVGTRAILQQAWKCEKKVAVPKIEGDSMCFSYIKQFSDLSEGYRGIKEPREIIPANDKNALVIMPGVAFDKQKNRIGYGKGYYDKYLKMHGSCATIALCFELQMLELIPAEEYDYHPDLIITEEAIYE